jgi:hypothetical protein
LLPNEYSPALARDNADVIDTGIGCITETGIIDKKGKCYDVNEPLMGINIKDIDGQDLNAVWSPGCNSWYLSDPGKTSVFGQTPRLT